MDFIFGDPDGTGGPGWFFFAWITHWWSYRD